MKSKHLRKKIIAILVISIMAMMFIASCAQEDTPATQTTTPAPGATAAPGYENGEDDGPPPRVLPNLPEMDWGGYVFRVMGPNYTGGDWIDWVPRDIAVEELTGNPLNDAVYNRNSILFDRYNFLVEQLESGDIAGDVRRAVAAGDTPFDAVTFRLRDTAGHAQAGLLVDLKNVPHLDLEKPWWDQQAVANLSIGNRLFFTSGDFVLVNWDACPGILFNKELWAQFALDCPYEMVRNGEWTLPRVLELGRIGAADLSGGGGDLDWRTDRFGFIGQRDTLIALFHGTGGLIASKDQFDQPYIVFNNERNFRAMEAIYDIMYDTSFALNLHFLPGDIYPLSEQIFQENRGLMMWVRLRIVENLRGMEADFGILPMPWLDENQHSWGHTVNSFTGRSMAIPNFHDPDSLERAGFILEAIAAESRYTVIPAYYDVQLTNQIARDEESGYMLDIIFSSTVWDIGEIMNWGGFSHELIFMSMNFNRNIASEFERRERIMVREVERMADRFAELD